MCFLRKSLRAYCRGRAFGNTAKRPQLSMPLPASLLERWLRPLGNNGDIFKGPSVAGEKDFQNPEELCPKSAVTEH